MPGVGEAVDWLRLKTKLSFLLCSWSLEAADSFWHQGGNMYIVRFFP